MGYGYIIVIFMDGYVYLVEVFLLEVVYVFGEGVVGLLCCFQERLVQRVVGFVSGYTQRVFIIAVFVGIQFVVLCFAEVGQIMRVVLVCGVFSVLTFIVFGVFADVDYGIEG